MTLLEIVQKTLDSMGSDAVDSISDTKEALDIAGIVENVYYEIVENQKIYSHLIVTVLTALSDSTTPTHMQLPVNTKDVEMIKYNVSKDSTLDYKEMTWCEPELFLSRSHSKDSSDTTNNQIVTLDTGVKIIVGRNEYPSNYTSFDDTTLIFNSYYDTDESSMQASKSMVYLRKVPVFSLTDDYTPEMDASYFPLLLNEVKATAFVEKKQTPNPKAEQKARQQKVRIQNDRQKNKGSNGVPNYGRKR